VTDGHDPPAANHRGKRITVTVLGCRQILSWGSTFYLPAVLASPIVRETGWPYDQVVAGLSVGLLVAGLVSPRTGRAIGAHGGRPILALGAVLLSVGFILIGTSQNLAWYFFGWAVLGVGMGAGLYDAAFATLGRIYGRGARGAITGVTLFGGFASTVCWPFSAYLVEHFGWRAACFAYAAIQLLIALPLYLLALPRNEPLATSESAPPPEAEPIKAGERPIFFVLAAALTVSAAILAMMGAHLLTLMQARGLDLTAAVALGMLIGPSAVGARLVEMLAGDRYHPIWTMTASVVLVALGACLFLTDAKLFAVAIVLYASGNGIGSIAKGTLPLALFGPARYPSLMGRLALPIMFAMALSPFLSAVALQRGGATWTFALFLLLALTNVFLVAVLSILSRKRC
jgi:predicted MFS family arabinose efflux permease